MMLLIMSSQAQYDGAANGIAFKFVGVDYNYPINNEGIGWKNATLAGEVTYNRHIMDYLNIAVPLKIGRVDLPIDETNVKDDRFFGSLDVLAQLKYFKETNFIYPYLFAGVGGVLQYTDDVDVNFPVGLGINWRLASHVYLQTQAEYRFATADFRDNAQLSAGLMWILAPPPNAEKEAIKIMDMDGDGVADAEDNCPMAAGPVNLNGCPDTDGDMIVDKDDKCPDSPGTAALMGCPDTDGDGVSDGEDKCPNEPGTAANAGCPLVDSDGDGVPDGEDDCPNIAGLKRFNGCVDRDADGISDNLDACPDLVGVAQFNGCPDTDKDGVADKDDRCPTTAGPVSNNGCPEVKAIREDVKKTLEMAMRSVQFETSRDLLKGVSLPVLDQIAGIMGEYVGYNLRIGGHTDSIGDRASNQKLSEKRAKACYDYLVSKGVSPDRMSHSGYGETQPIADNMYKDGRQKNRRVEFQLYQR